MMFLWALFLLLSAPLSATKQVETFFVQPGGSVTLPSRYQPKEENVYVRWYLCPNQESQEILIWKHPKQDAPKNEAPENFKKRVSLSKDSSLIISPVEDGDFNVSVTFKCELQDYRSRTEYFYRLLRVKMPSSLTLLAGEDLSLPCEMDPSGPTTPVKFIAPNNAIYDNPSRNSLLVKNISFQHNGVWTCQGKNNPSKLRAITTVTVIDLAVQNTTYTSTSSTSPPWLLCSLTSAIPWPTLQERGLQAGSWSFTPLYSSHEPKQLLDLQSTPAWKKPNNSNNSPYDNFFLKEQGLKDHHLSVQTTEVSQRIRGMYTCSLKFKAGITLSRTLKLEVLEVLSSPNATNGGVTVQAGDTVNLTCSLGHSLRPSALHLEWVPPKSSAFSPGNPTHPEHLSIPAVRVQDSGQWTCRLKSTTTTLTSATVTLKVEKLVHIWIIVAVSSALFLILLVVITVFFVRRHKQAMMYRRRKAKFCCCKTPKSKGFYKT